MRIRSPAVISLPPRPLLGGPPWTVAAIVLFSTVAAFSLGAEPAIAAQLSRQLLLPPHGVGLLLSIEGGAAMLATLPAWIWMKRRSPRQIVSVAAAVFVAANLLSGRYPIYEALLAWRALAGLAGGTLLIVTLTSAASCANPERVYAGWVIGQNLAATAGLYGLERLFDHYGLSAGYLLMGGAMLLAWPLSMGFGAAAGLAADRSLGADESASARPGEAATALGALLTFYTCLGGIWAFAAQRGTALALAAEQVAALLAAANLLGLPGAAVAAWIGRSPWRRQLILAGHATLGVSLLLFASGGGWWAFAGCIVLLQTAWSFTAPFLLSLAAEIEPAGSMMIPANFVLGAGLAAGPLITGFVLEARGGFAIAAALGEALLTAGAVLVWVHSRLETRRA